MLRILLVSLAVMAAAAAEQSCYKEVNEDCAINPNNLEFRSCHALYGGFSSVKPDLETYANMHLWDSYDFLLSSTYFNNYKKNREGFGKLFRKMSDDTWQKTIDIIKHITKRGGTWELSRVPSSQDAVVVEQNELGALSHALDTHKKLADYAFHIHRLATRNEKEHHDAEVAHYLEEEFMEEQAGIIRDLAGYTNDLKKFITEHKGKDKSLAFYLFDEYLGKVA